MGLPQGNAKKLYNEFKQRMQEKYPEFILSTTNYKMLSGNRVDKVGLDVRSSTRKGGFALCLFIDNWSEQGIKELEDKFCKSIKYLSSL